MKEKLTVVVNTKYIGFCMICMRATHRGLYFGAYEPFDRQDFFLCKKCHRELALSFIHEA